MSKIPYRPDLTISQNIARIREHTGMTNADLGKQIDVRGEVFAMYASCGFKTNAGNETSVTRKIRAHAESFFTDGIPDVVFRVQTSNLYELFGCASCEFRTKSHQGCYKFGITKAEINGGYFITASDMSAFALSKTQPCPYATK